MSEGQETPSLAGAAAAESNNAHAADAGKAAAAREATTSPGQGRAQGEDQRIPTVTYLGPAGTFTEAALMHFVRQGYCAQPPAHLAAGLAAPTLSEAPVEQLSGEQQSAASQPAQSAGTDYRAHTVPVDSPNAALAAVAEGRADYACVAIESSVDGPVTPTYDALALGAPLQIYREVDIPIVFSILVRPGTELANVKTWSSHPVARPQVIGWTDTHMPNARFVAATSNAAAAAMVAAGEVDAAAAPARAGEIYELESVAENVADVSGARTRFVLVGKPGVPTVRTGRDRTSVVFNLHNQPGALVSALTVVSSHGVDLTRIESRPTRKQMGEYRFYMDMCGHIADPYVASALHDLHQMAAAVRYLGSWPISDPDEVAPMASAEAWLASTQWVADRARGVAPADDALW